MFKRENFLPLVTPGVALILMVLGVLLGGCSLISSSAATPDVPPLSANEHKRIDGTLAFDVVDFNWVYKNDGSHMVVSGEVINNSDKPQQALTIFVEVYDEGGSYVGSGRSYLTPTYLPVGSKGSFEFTLLPIRTEGIKFLKIITNTRTLQ